MDMPTPPASSEPPIANIWNWQWTVIGAIYGFALRVLFGALLEESHGLMTAAFLLGSPFVVGAITVYGLRGSKISGISMIFRPWASVLLMLLGCIATHLEGTICIVIMMPLFLICGSVGGL